MIAEGIHTDALWTIIRSSYNYSQNSPSELVKSELIVDQPSDRSVSKWDDKLLIHEDFVDLCVIQAILHLGESQVYVAGAHVYLVY